MTKVLNEVIFVAAIEMVKIDKIETNIPVIVSQRTTEPNDVSVSKIDDSKTEDILNITKTEHSKKEYLLLFISISDSLSYKEMYN